MRFAALAAICVTFASGSYLAFDLSHAKRLKFPDLALAPKTLPHPAPATTEVQPSEPPPTHSETIAESASQSAAPTASESSSIPIEPEGPSSSPAESPSASGVVATPVWAPLVAGILPARGPAAETLSKPDVNSDAGTIVQMPSKDAPDSSEPEKPIAAAEQMPGPTSATSSSETTGNASSDVTQKDASSSDSIREPPPIVMLQPSDLRVPELSVESSPTPSANRESLTREDTQPEQKVNEREGPATTPSKSNELSTKTRLAAPNPDSSPKIQHQPSPTGNVSLTQSKESARKSREIALARSTANLYSGTPTPPPRPPPTEQKTESDASMPPPPVDLPSKSVSRDRSEGTGIAGDLRRFAANYVRDQEKDNVASQARYYAGSVHFYGEGDLSWTRIAAATRRYHQNSRQRRYNISPASVRGPVDGGFWIVEQPYTWSKSDGTRVQTGRSVLRMRVIPWGRGDFKITSIEEVGK
jgi:hypothetical protein